MIAPGGPLRSVLYVPASNGRALDKARTLPCDGIIIDLEDAVGPEAKALARDQAVAALKAGGFGRRRVVLRVNALDTPWGEEDLLAAVEGAPDAVLVPKVGDSADLARYDGRLARAPEHTRLWCMIETCRSLFHLEGLGSAARTSRLDAWVMGTNDLLKEMGARQTPGREPLHAALGLAVAGARAHGLAVLDGVYNALEDADGFEREARQALDFGFDGKTLIHPGQIEACNRVFSPSAEEVAFARAVVEAFASPAHATSGAIRVGGRMVERLHLAQAERTLAAAGA